MTPGSDLNERLVAILDSGPRPVTADRAIEMASRVHGAAANERTRRSRPPGHAAWAWLGLVVALIAGLVLGVKTFSTPPVRHGANVAAGQPTATALRPPSKSKVDKATAPPKQSWPEQVIADVGSAEDVAPTAQALYWLSLPGSRSDSGPETVAPHRFDESSHQMTTGPSMTGYGVGNPAITVTGGWVWVVVGGTKTIEVAQYDPQTMAIHREQTFTVTQLPPHIVDTPVLSATVNGPLWVGAADDLWALDPSTGAVDTQFDAGFAISSMSTDPTGALLYVGGSNYNSPTPGVVSEYDAQNGRKLSATTFYDVGTPAVAAATGAVWEASRGGMMGSVVELSSSNLKKVGPPDQGGSGNTYDQQMGFSVAVSNGVLWLGNVSNGFQCADPGTGAIRATEVMPADFIDDPYARDGVVYAIEGSQLVAITPPAACFR